MNLQWLLAQAEEQSTPLEQLPPQERLAVLTSLLALVLTGMVLVALTMIGAHWVRRVVRERKPSRDWPKPDYDAASDDPPEMGEAPDPSEPESTDTIDARRRSDETHS